MLPPAQPEEPPTPAPRVRDLARRFEPSTEPLEKRAPAKRIGKFRLNEHGQMYRINNPPVRVGVVRKKSSLKRRSQSASSLHTTSVQREPSMRKSRTLNFPRDDGSRLSQRSNEEEITVSRDKTTPPSVSPKPRLRPCPPVKPARLLVSTTRECVHGESTRQSGEKESEMLQTANSTFRVTSDARSSSLCRPRCPPPAPPKGPSRERINRIPSYRNPAVRPIRMRRKSSSEDDYQHLPSPPLEREDMRFEGLGRMEGEVPRIPSIPPPPLPPCGEYSDDSQCYEEIGNGPIMNDDDMRIKGIPHVEPSTSSGSYTEASTYNSVSPNGDSQLSDYNYVTNIYCGEQADKCEAPSYCSCSSCFSRRRFSQLPFKSSDDTNHGRSSMMTSSATNHDRSFHLATLARPKKPRRPVSTLELDKLFKFKSELQLNISKKMDQLRQKVGERRPRSAKCRIGDDMLSTDRETRSGYERTRESRDPDDDRYIYGDDWSSDEEDVNAYDDRRSSMYKELEEQLNKAFPVTAMSSEGDYDTADLVIPATSPSIAPSFSASEESRTRPEELQFNRLSLTGQNPSLDEPSPDYDYSRQYTSRLPMDQPLYQIYMMEEREKLVDDVILRGETEPIEQIVPDEQTKTVKSRRESSVSSDSGRGADCSTSASALTSNTSMRRERLMAGSHFGSQRSLWCELAEVKSAGLLETLDDDTKLRQEAYFEVITSEASYLRSLNILITHFMASQEMLGSKSALSVITNADRKHLFSNIFAVRDCSERLLCDLESRLEENLVLDDVCDILMQHFEHNFDVYVKYCSNQVYQDRTLRRLKSENPGFLAAVSRLEADRQCQGLDMRSFLMLPMQRVTRYPLLMYAIIDRTSSESPKYAIASRALESSNKVVRECNEGARRMERTEQLLEVDKRIVYNDADIKRIPLVSNSRHLVKRGTLTQLVERRSKNILQGRQKARSIHVFLFSDMIMITKKKLNGTYVCKDYAPRRYIDIEPLEPDNPRVPAGAVSSLATRPHLFLCVLMRNARGRQTELLLSAESETDRERWLSAIRPPTSLNPEEKVYAEWDCPQAVTVHPYSKGQEDEIDLETGDMINILRKMPDGWFFGERCRDGVGGWFPSSYVQQILNDHVRANNYRHRLRLIQAASGAPRGSVGRGATPFMDRLRRMSNPRSFFTQGGTVGL